MAKKVVIFGATNLARHVRMHLSRHGGHEVAAFTVHREFIDQPSFEGLEVVPFETITDSHPQADFALCVAVGYLKMNQVRAQIFQQCKRLGYSMVSYIYPHNAMLAPDLVEIGENSFVFEGCTLQPGVKIGDNVIIWANNLISHDSLIGDHCFITSGVNIAGNVEIGSSSFIGLGASIIDGVKVAPNNLIGAGTTNLDNTKNGDVFITPGARALENTPAALAQHLLLR